METAGTSFTKNKSSNLFNSAIVAAAVSSAYELGILSELESHKSINILDFCDQRNLHKASVTAIISALCCFDICRITNNQNLFKQGSNFVSILNNQGLLFWLISHQGITMQNIASLTKKLATNQENKSKFIELQSIWNKLSRLPEFANSLFNSAVAASVVSAAYELGILSELKLNQVINISVFCQENSLDKSFFTWIISVLCKYDICEITNNINEFSPGAEFTNIYRDQGFFLWLIRGSGTIMEDLASIAKDKYRTSKLSKRDGKYIAIASHEQGSRFIDPYFNKVMNELPFNTVADFGCGSAERLINLAKKHPSMRGIGIDINSDAVKLAKMSIHSEGLESQVTVFQDNIKDLKLREEFLDVDTLMCFLCGHDFWPRQECLVSMQNLRSVFPNVKRFLLCDTYRSGIVPSSEVPIFTLGFEFIHALTEQYVPLLSEWMDLFKESGWDCVRQSDVEIPYTTIFDLRPRVFRG